MKQLYALLIFTILFPSLESIAQNEIKYERTLSISEFIKEISTLAPDSTIKMNNVNIVGNKTTDIRYLNGAESRYSDFKWDSVVANYPMIEIPNKLSFNNIRFAQRVVLPKIHFRRGINIEGMSTYGDINFRNCIFEKRVYMLRIQAYYFTLTNCIFNGDTNFETVEAQNFNIENTQFNNNFWVYNIGEPLNLSVSNSLFRGYSTFVSLNPGILNIYNSRFEKNKKMDTFNSGGISSFKQIKCVNDTFKLPFELINTSIKENFTFIKCILQDKNSFQSISLPEGNTYARWTQFEKNKFGVSINDSTYYNGKNAIDSTTQDEYYALIKVYSQFLRAYKNNGDQESYNECYIEMKDIQTRKSAFNFKQTPSVNNYFEWKLNRFLKIFCDYGTNPVKALIVSTYVIILFGLLYFVFPSEGEAIDWKRLSMALKNRKKMMPLIKKELFIGFKQLANAMALSMNAFVTLGYGEMPARGIARYLAVFEGLTGWFLLSIFSASLISQILQ
jgi:hypothetical protein